jgi:hypothetical protein
MASLSLVRLDLQFFECLIENLYKPKRNPYPSPKILIAVANGTKNNSRRLPDFLPISTVFITITKKSKNIVGINIHGRYTDINKINKFAKIAIGGIRSI